MQNWVTAHKVLFLNISPFSQCLSHNKVNQAWFAFLKGQLGDLVYIAGPIPVFSLYSLLSCKLFQEHGQKQVVVSGFAQIHCDVEWDR